jgi:hypothetical protein
MNHDLKKIGFTVIVAFCLFVMTFIIAKTQIVRSSSASENLFLPLITLPPEDIALHQLEISQAVQTASNSVPLIAERNTVLRVYATYSGNMAIQDVDILIEAIYDGSVVASEIITTTIPLNTSRDDYGSSINFHLPSAWLTGSYDLRVLLNANEMVEESSRENNEIVLPVNFIAVPPLELVIVPVVYTHTPTGDILPSPTEESVTDFIMRTLPFSEINVTWHTPISYQGDLLTEKPALGAMVADVKAADNAPFSDVYMGYYSECLPNGGQCMGTYGGYGDRSARIIVMANGPDFNGNGDGYTAAHEIGHAMGRSHAPCGNPPNVDPDYPYPGATIGPTTYGLDTVRGVVWPPSTFDLMSYCGQWWPSDYTYIGVLQGHLSGQ